MSSVFFKYSQNKYAKKHKKDLANIGFLGYSLLMQIKRDSTYNSYQTKHFRLSTVKGKKQHVGKNIFTVFISDYSANAVYIERKEACNILRQIRREKRTIAKFNQ